MASSAHTLNRTSFEHEKVIQPNIWQKNPIQNLKHFVRDLAWDVVQNLSRPVRTAQIFAYLCYLKNLYIRRILRFYPANYKSDTEQSSNIEKLNQQTTVYAGLICSRKFRKLNKY